MTKFSESVDNILKKLENYFSFFYAVGIVNLFHESKNIIFLQVQSQSELLIILIWQILEQNQHHIDKVSQLTADFRRQATLIVNIENQWVVYLVRSTWFNK